MSNQPDLVEFTHRGQTFYADENERIYDPEKNLIGYISSRGAQYIWCAVRLENGEEIEFNRGSGMWGPHNVPEEDPALDSILRAHGREVQT